jgi:MEDS: MEthanogen/methylotroph, DcmR Sensory domain
LDDGRLAGVEVHNAPPHDHAVHVYADDSAIGQELIRFVEEGLTLGESVVVAANGQHRACIAEWRSNHPSISDDEFFLVVDAAETLKAFMVADTPNPALFNATIGAIVERAARGGRAVRVFGEMVALLWAEGNVTGALALETLWNELASNQRFFLLCAYPEALLDEVPLHAVNAMCDRHSDLSLLGYLGQFARATTATLSNMQRLLIPIPTAVSAARQIAIQTLVDWELPHLIHDSAILTSELAANAVLHAESCFRLTLSRGATCLRIAVDDGVACAPATDSSTEVYDRSRLSRIQSIASDWGCDVTPSGKTLWAELQL